MSNKQERYFVVSERELETLRWTGYMDIQRDIDAANAACRARPVILAGVETDAETYYMVTKKELNEFGTYQLGLVDLTKRPIPVWATHFAGDHIAGHEFMQSEEMKE
jgi:hypothetical protein